MTEKRNYCVDGKCTVDTEIEYEKICKYFKPCNHRCCAKIPDKYTHTCHHSAIGFYCGSNDANAECQQSHGDTND